MASAPAIKTNISRRLAERNGLGDMLAEPSVIDLANNRRGSISQNYQRAHILLL
jgi:hypothetical protein